MKSSTQVIALIAALLALPTMRGQIPTSEPVLKPLRVLRGDLPVFPYEMTQLGVREGKVRIAFSVDVNGKMDDCLAIAYTNPEFARVSVAALRRWRFVPAEYHGIPIAAESEVTINFETQGTVVVSLNASESIAAWMYSLSMGQNSTRPCTLKELDRIPTPIAAPSPSMPASLARPGASGHVTVTFYIDQQGSVRLPSIDPDDDPLLGAAAIDALKNWRFEPPTRRGHPVLVRASQEFNFHAPAKAPPSMTLSN